MLDLAPIANYALFVATMAAMTAGFTALYLWITPYRELALVRAGNVTAAVALVGAILGFALAIKGVAHGAVHLTELLAWSAAACVGQLAAYFLVTLLLPGFADGVRDDKLSYGVLLAGLHVAFGLLNAGAVSV